MTVETEVNVAILVDVAVAVDVAVVVDTDIEVKVEVVVAVDVKEKVEIDVSVEIAVVMIGKQPVRLLGGQTNPLGIPVGKCTGAIIVHIPPL